MSNDETISLHDSEILLLIGHHTKVMADLAFRLDYSADFYRHQERLTVLNDWFGKSLAAREA